MKCWIVLSFWVNGAKLIQIQAITLIEKLNDEQNSLNFF